MVVFMTWWYIYCFKIKLRFYIARDSYFVIHLARTRYITSYVSQGEGLAVALKMMYTRAQ